jgi:hypothetical protein
VKRSKVLLAPLHKQLLYVVIALLWLSGAVWIYLYETSPSRPLWMKIHGAAAMVFLILFGTLLMQHVPEGWRQDRQRSSGVSLLGLCGLLIVTGWGLYYWGDDTLRQWTTVIHTGVGLALPVLIWLHVWLGRRSSST